MPRFPTVILTFVIVLLFQHSVSAQVTLVKTGNAVGEIVVDKTNASGNGIKILDDAGTWLADCVKRSANATLPVKEKLSDQPSVIIARADAHAKLAKDAGLKSKAYDAFCIVTRKDRVYILGNSEAAARHGVATLLRQLGFRWFAPSPQWHIVPKSATITVNMNIVDEPKLVHRGIWYAYAGGEAELMNNYRRWAIANRLSVASVIRTGHSYGNIIGRNKDMFAKHPEYYALLPNGKRDTEGSINARKFCFTNPGLIDLVVKDRIKLLEEYRKANPAAFMVSVDPSDGQGTCHCEECQKLGSDTNRVLHLANHVAKGLREKHPDGWVGLYAYSSHRLPPTIQVEPNVYVQVAMGFNRTKYTLPQLVELWSKKVGAIGLREYYGVEAWDWGLPGRMRGSHVAYHKKWIPFYAQRKLNAVNAETNANWGGQTLGLYVAAQMMWDPSVDPDALVDEYYTQAFGKAATPMRKLLAKFDNAPPLRSATLVPMYADLHEAWMLAKEDPEVRRRLVDLMAYLVYVAKFREFDLVRNASPSRGDEYYRALLPLMQYTWQIRMRDVVHHYALARRLCNGLPVGDKRLDFYMFNKKKPPVWKQGEQITDDEIVTMFLKYREHLQADGNPVVVFSRYLDPVRVPGADVGPCERLGTKEDGVAEFRKELTGFLIPAGKQKVRFAIAPTGRSATMTVTLRTTVFFEKTFAKSETFQPVEFELPRANEYRVTIKGGVKLRVPKETPFLFEASATNPAWIEYSGPHYFYVPKNAKELIVDAGPRLSLYIPDQKSRVDVTPSSRESGKDYAVIKVPPKAAGKIWHTSNQTRGQVSFLNIPPLMSFHRQTIFVPRELAEAEGLTTKD